MKNIVQQDKIQNCIDELKSKGWKVKVNYGVLLGCQVIDGFLANKKHINFRASDSDRYISGIGYVNGWSFRVFARNMNGGYVLIDYGLDIGLKEVAILKSEDPEPPIPNWNKDELPKPFEFSQHMETVYYKRQGDGQYSIEHLITSIQCMDVVSINKKCIISSNAIVGPDNSDIWVLMWCSGTQGSFYMISNGDTFYLIRKIKDKYKISMDNINVDISHFGLMEKKIVNITIQDFLKTYESRAGV